MGSYIEMNDTLQITGEQGFPPELDLETHLKQPIKLSAVQGKVFEFMGKPAIRNYHQPPVRVFLAQNINDKWVYWGLIHILEVTHDYMAKTTSGKYKIVKLNAPEEMKQMFALTDARAEMDYFA
jgi:hypothetical protein